MSDIQNKLSVKPENLQYHCDESIFQENDVDPCCSIIGQDRAMSAVQLGLEIHSKGYNIFVTGQPGTGRTTAVKLLLEGANGDEELALKDICYVNNFLTPDCPQVLYFQAGEGRKFQKAINYLLNSLVTVIPKIFSGNNYRQKRERIIKEFDSRQKDMFIEFEKTLKEKSFTLVQLQYGSVVRPDLQPLINGEPIAIAELEKAVIDEKMEQAQLDLIKTEYENLSKEFKTLSQQSKNISGSLEDELDRLDTSLVVPLINDKIETLQGIYKDEKVQAYLADLNEVLFEELDIFRPSSEAKDEQDGIARLRDLFNDLAVNLLVDNKDLKKRPVIVEEFPSYKNLFGAIERVYSPGGGWRSDFTRIQGGSLVQANGGYLVINAVDLFSEPQVWPMLKRTLKTGHLVISNVETPMMSGGGLKPEAIDIDVKVIIIGESRIYDALFMGDSDFKKVFKIKAEFDNVMINNKDGVAQYAQFTKKITDQHNLLAVDKSGLAAIAEHGVKLSGRKDRLSTRFTEISDIIRESSWIAKKQDQSEIDRKTVKQAILQQTKRVNLVEKKIHEMYEREIYLLEVDGREVGQINGLSVYDLGEHAFGRPTRITASLAPGADGVINIEREASMSGRTHDKGVLILSGFMRNRFGRKTPLVFTASLCFEQSYSGIDGDSASSTEIYALLSALTDKPIYQGFAVTGSVNQKGEIQPIGGVNEKVEGFFDTCKIKGLTGKQGVLIPIQNKADLMLKDEIVEAVRDNKFAIYAISTIDEGVEILTGIPAGERDAKSEFPEGSINNLAQRRLIELAETWRDYIRS